MYNVVDNIEDANFWMAQEDEQPIIGNFTSGKLYELLLLPMEYTSNFGQTLVNEDYWVLDDSGQYIMAFLGLHKGVLVKQEEH